MASLEAERLIPGVDYLCFPSKFCGCDHGRQGLRILTFPAAVCLSGDILCVAVLMADLPGTRVGSGASAAAPPVGARVTLTLQRALLGHQVQ